MSVIKGITVTLHEKTISGYDDFNAPIETDQTTEVKNVLVYPASSTDITDNLNMHGIAVQYALCIPKGDDHNWRDTQVEFFGQIWRTIGEPKEYIEAMLPLDWNKQIMVAKNE